MTRDTPFLCNLPGLHFFVLPGEQQSFKSHATRLTPFQPPVSRHSTTTRILSKDYFELRDKALLAHATQVGPGDLFFALTPEQSRQVWPTDDYVLIDSKVKTSLPEHDFATGIDFSS